jgi:hypothetical protein
MQNSLNYQTKWIITTILLINAFPIGLAFGIYWKLFNKKFYLISGTIFGIFALFIILVQIGFGFRINFWGLQLP